MAVIGMQAVPLPGIVAQDHLRADPADAQGDLGPLRQSRLEFAVRPTEERDLAAATQPAGRVALLGLAVGNQLGRVLLRVPRPFRAVSADDVVNATAGRRPLGQRAAAAEFDVVGMGSDGHGDRRDREVDGRWREEAAVAHRVAHLVHRGQVVRHIDVPCQGR